MNGIKTTTQLNDWLQTAGEIVQLGPEDTHKAIQLCDILTQLDSDYETMQAAIMSSLSPLNEEQIAQFRNAFGDGVYEIFAGVERVGELAYLLIGQSEKGQRHSNDENLRKMLITMVDDVRVVLIQLSFQLLRLRLAKALPSAEQQSLARLTLDVYAPLANRLGVWQLKWELEDFALRYLQPDTYKKLAKQVDEKRLVRENYIDSFIQQLQNKIKQADIACSVYGRPKHLYSIWKKMQQKGLSFENVWDIRAVRILVDNVNDCYSVLGIVHTSWKHLPGEFDDYIATPKKNGYRSIHTVVIGPENKSVEVQIRTQKMHEENELGVAAHWRYKEKRGQDEDIDSKVLWLRQLLEWKAELLEGDEVSERNFAERVEDKRVFVFTPKGTVVDLPALSTPIDFAYTVHTEVGHRTRGARINGKMVPLDTSLKTGDQVEILTTKEGGPSRDWLREDLGYTITHRARSRIAHWFKQKDYNQHLSMGRSLLEKELNRLGVDDLAYDKIAAASPFNKIDDLLVALGAGDYKLSRALLPFKRQFQDPVEALPKKKKGLPKKQNDSFRVLGVGNLMTHMANCCSPIPGDSIVGYITIGRGVTIHRQNCQNIKNLDDEYRNRLVEVEWGGVEDSSYVVEIQIDAYNRSHLLHDVTDVLKSNNINVLLVNMDIDDEQIAHIYLRLEISGLLRLSTILANLASIQNVLDVRRLTH